jgi:UDP-N-acetylmuramate-alanine ligase
MSSKHEIEIEISETGEVKAHIKGIPGKGCSDVAKILKEIVGEVKSDAKTSEYYQPEPKIGVDINSKK